VEFISEYGLFLAKTVTFVVAAVFILGSVAALAQKQRRTEDWELEVTHLNERFKHYRQALEHHLLDKETLKRKDKEARKAEKEKLKAEKKSAAEAEKKDEKRIFVLDFNGDIRASEVNSLRECVTAVLAVAAPLDEVVLRLESPGGMVHGYGLAASQLARLRDRNIPLTVCVDKVAASGGYLMACLANRIVAAPFAIIGSIGVVAQIPNVNRLLKKHDIDYEVLTAGEYKRTLTVFGENTEKGREKFQQDLEETHQLFKEWVADHRPQLNINEVSKGEVWYGRRALDLNLVDRIATSDDYLQQHAESAAIYQVKYHERKKLAEKLGLSMATMIDSSLLRLSKLFAVRS
jgi:serine protease SohB